MPLELGMAAAFRFERENTDRPHRWLVLVPEGYAYQSFVSDLAGFDPARHDRSVSSIIREVSAWLRTQAIEKETWADILLAASKSVPRPQRRPSRSGRFSVTIARKIYLFLSS
jgi:hypothetical protein